VWLNNEKKLGKLEKKLKKADKTGKILETEKRELF